QDLQHVLERFAAECEAAGMRISTSKFRGHGSRPGKGWRALSRWVGGEVLPQVEEFKYLGVLFTSEGKMEREIDKADWCSVLQLCGSPVVMMVVRIWPDNSLSVTEAYSEPKHPSQQPPGSSTEREKEKKKP
ncbi:hypothetical protein L3Q82_022793, partial [Scortum barcoo]